MKTYIKKERLAMGLVCLLTLLSIFLLREWYVFTALDYIILIALGGLALLGLTIGPMVPVFIAFLITLVYGGLVIVSAISDRLTEVGISYLYLLLPTLVVLVTGLIREANHRYFVDVDKYRSAFEALIRIDALTGFRNVTDYINNLQEEINRSKRHETGLSLMHIRVHNLEHVGQTYGYNEGQKFVISLSQHIINLTRSIDKHYRIADNVFAVILPNTDEKGAASLRARFIENIEKEDIIVSHKDQELEVRLDVVCITYKDMDLNAQQFHAILQEGGRNETDETNESTETDETDESTETDEINETD